MEIISHDSGLRIVSYNCRSIKSSIGAVKNLCLDNDIILIQEHWLMPGEISYLSTVDSNFVFFGSSAVDVSSAVLCGRPYGGTAILCRQNIAGVVKPVKCDNTRITAIELAVHLNGSLTTILLVSVYMPVDVGVGQTDEDFEFVSGCLNALIAESQVNGYILAGDFNFHLKSQRHKSIMKALDDHHAVLADEYALHPGSFTYVSDSHNTTSWIDHVLTNQCMLSFLSNMSVLYDIVSSDHRPLRFCLTTDAVCSSYGTSSDAECVRMVSDWSACSQTDIDNYARGLEALLQSVPLPPICCMPSCGIKDHQNDIDAYYQAINACINRAMHRFVPLKRSSLNDLCVAGWTDIVADKHEAARQAFMEWIVSGKPRTGYVCEAMKRTRAQFKLALRYCRNHEEMLRNNALARDFLNKNDKGNNFWKNIKRATSSKMTCNATTVGGVTGDDNVANMWKDSFQQLYSIHNNDGMLQDFSAYQTDNTHVFTHADLCSAIMKLKCNKAYGPDGISAEAIKYGGQLLSVHLTILFNMFTAHCYLPADFMKTTVVPLLKNKSGDICDVNNYRAIALSNCTSKLLESVILHCFQLHDTADSDYQFGFKTGHSTSLGCSVLKQVLNYYRANGSYIFACFLDLSKAFDSVNHKTMFRQLTALKFPANLVQLLVFWYANQQMNVRWKNIVTDCFHVKNGTRQGSVLSPYLFCIYMRHLTTIVVKSGIGCHIAGLPVNILLYADDLVLLAPSWLAQQKLLNICAVAVADLDMNFNTSKSYTMIFEPYNRARRINCVFPSLVLNASHLNTVCSFKYLGHILSASAADNDDIVHQMSLLYARANVLIRKFSKCSRDVKLCLFRTYCSNFYGAALWTQYNVTVLKRFEAAYVKCVKMFFGYDRLYSVTTMFCELGLPVFSTILHNAKCIFVAGIPVHANALVRVVHAVRAYQ